MIIKEINIKNFGKFHKEKISFYPGINVVYGENESGKTTIYLFLQGIFFGIRRKRGVASKTDTYTKCLPWENPSWYQGSVLFQSGEKDFRLDRNFDSRSQMAELYCVTDGEKMSVEEGDLEMLLGGITQRIYENTAAVGQLKSRTEEGLREELKEYLANFQTEGDFRLNPEAALNLLKEKRKKWEKEEKEVRERKEKNRESILGRIQYIREEIQELEEKLERSRDSIPEKVEKVKEEERQEPKEVFPLLQVFLLILIFLAGWAGVFFLKLSWLFLPLIFVMESVFFFWRLWTRKPKVLVKDHEEQDRIIKKERKKGQEMSWRESLGDKKNLLYNLQEELEELENNNEQIQKIQREAESITLAEKMLVQAVGRLQKRKGNSLKDRTWEILDELTLGKYQGGVMDENFQIRLDDGDRYVGLHQVSQGTTEQVYFALRMAAGELLCREEELPVLLDETFVMYDDRRLSQTLEWLYKNKSQVILFTCTKREIQVLKKLEIPWHQINL